MHTQEQDIVAHEEIPEPKIPKFNNLDRESIQNVGKDKNSANQPFYPFPRMFSILSKINFIWTTIKLSPVNAFMLDNWR